MEQYREHCASVAMPHSASASATAGGVERASAHYAEVWGDTVDLRHLGWSVVLGVGIGAGAFFAGKRILSPFVADPAIARAYAMLVGLAGCLLAGAVCARLFKPKRNVVEHATDETERMRALDLLSAEAGGLGSVDDLSAAAKAEMSELGLLELFAAHEASAASRTQGDAVAVQGDRR